MPRLVRPLPMLVVMGAPTPRAANRGKISRATSTGISWTSAGARSGARRIRAAVPIMIAATRFRPA